MFSSRPDGTPVPDVPAVRRIMPYIMRGRTESVVYFDQHVDLGRVETFIEHFNGAHPDTRITLFHVALWGLAQTLTEWPNLNRFVAGGRLYQRDGIWISYAAKKELATGSPIVTLKRRFDPAQPFADMVADMAADLRVGRSDEKSHTDKELGLLLRLPGPVLRAGVGVVNFADRLGLLPKSFVEPDPMFTSVFVANLGSLKMDAAYHHLFEYGNCPVFCVIGRTHEAPAVVDGAVVARREAVLRYTFDERIEDGLYAQRGLQSLQVRIEDPIGAGILGGTNGHVPGIPTMPRR